MDSQVPATQGLALRIRALCCPELLPPRHPLPAPLQVHPGQSTLAFYTARNMSDKAVTGISTYNVAPQQVWVWGMEGGPAVPAICILHCQCLLPCPLHKCAPGGCLF